MVTTAYVNLWGKRVGAVAWSDKDGYALFEFTPEFVQGKLDIAPIHMSLRVARGGSRTFYFPNLHHQTYHGLPGLLADSLPDKFGNQIINTWLTRQGRAIDSVNPVERLCYTGKRGMGALEYEPALYFKNETNIDIQIQDIVALTREVINQRDSLDVSLGNNEQANADAILDIVRVGTSAGGARAKTVIAMNKKGHVISGQFDVPKGYDYWILKLDGVSDLELGKTQSYGRIEYAYHLMARRAGIQMSECRLLEENGRAHFMTKRFDRVNGEKIHMQTLCGVAHFDYNMAGAYGYEQAFEVMRTLHLTKPEASEMFRRMIFNIVARNLDDHTKNISFLMEPDGQWKLAPAYDVIYAHNPAGKWTSQHQMSICGRRKQDELNLKILNELAASLSIKNSQTIIDEVNSAVSQWSDCAKEAGVPIRIAQEISQQHTPIKS